MRISRGSLAVTAVTLSLLILCSGCAAHYPAASIPAGTSVVHARGMNTIPPGPSVAPSGPKHFAGIP
jgi:hypothetical protein